MKQTTRLIGISAGFFLSPFAFSYVGPGAGVSAIGSALAFLAVIFLLIVGFLWYPLKKLFSKNKPKESVGTDTDKNDERSDQAKGL